MLRCLPLSFRSYPDHHAFIVVKRVEAILNWLVSSDSPSKLLVLNNAHGFTAAEALSAGWFTVMLGGRRGGIDRWSCNKLLPRYKWSLNASKIILFIFRVFYKSLKSADKNSLALSIWLSNTPFFIVINGLDVFWFICSGLFILMEVHTCETELWKGCLVKLSKGTYLLDLWNLGFSFGVCVKKDDFNSLMTHNILLL